MWIFAPAAFTVLMLCERSVGNPKSRSFETGRKGGLGQVLYVDCAHVGDWVPCSSLTESISARTASTYPRSCCEPYCSLLSRNVLGHMNTGESDLLRFYLPLNDGRAYALDSDRVHGDIIASAGLSRSRP